MKNWENVKKPALTFKRACETEMPFGKYKGEKLDVIAKTDEGLLYLDWLRGQDWFLGPTKRAVEKYLNNPAIERDLVELLS